jgi:RNA polymerase primary sigma factor
MHEKKGGITLANESHVDEITLDQAKEQLIESGKKQGVLTYKSIMEKLASFEQDPQQIDDFFEVLTEQGIIPK